MDQAYRTLRQRAMPWRFTHNRRMLTRSLLPVALLAATATLAQMPEAPVSRSGDPLDKAKSAKFLERYADEVRAKKAIDTGRMSLRTQRYRDALKHFDGPKLAVTWDRFVTANGTSFVAVHLAVPAGMLRAGVKLTAFGQIAAESGRELTNFEEPIVLEGSKGDLFIERTLFFDPVKAVGGFGLAAGDEILAVGHATSDVTTVPPPRGLSDLIVSNNVYNLPQAQAPFEPFAFGGTKVIPKADLTFRREDEVWLFAEFRDTAVPTDHPPSLSMRVNVEGNGQRIAGQWQPVDPAPLKGVPGHFGVGTTVDVSSLKPGQYTLVLSVRDAEAKETYERSRTIVVR